MPSNEHPVGSIRPSQLLWTYGPGAMIDLPNFSVITMGLDFWKTDVCREIKENRLLEEVRRRLHPGVLRLLAPPLMDEDDPNPAAFFDGVPVRPFPRTFRCSVCQDLAAFDLGTFRFVPSRFRPEKAKFVHDNCTFGRHVDAISARFLVACDHGHVDEFPWHWFVHGGPSDCRGTLKFHESDSFQAQDVWVECTECGRKRPMVQAFDRSVGNNVLPACRGHHPHLNSFEPCDAELHPILLGASNSWFPVTVSVLDIPTREGVLRNEIRSFLQELSAAPSPEILPYILTVLKSQGKGSAIHESSPEEVWNELQAIRGESRQVPATEAEDVKRPEWNVLVEPEGYVKWPDFVPTAVPPPQGFGDKIAGVLLLERLRKVNALIGFTRIEAEDDFSGGGSAQRAPLSSRPPTWVPAAEVRGEGVFIRIKEEAIAAWSARQTVKDRAELLLRGYKGWRRMHKRTPEEAGFPGIRHYFLHTLSHLLLREFALECGYNAASLQERVYSSDEPGREMAGILIYTAAADSDGTLGGLVRLGEPDTLGRILRSALNRAGICSSDPICSENVPSAGAPLHAAACHACAFASETSCESGNRYLDRALVVPTFKGAELAFFQAEDIQG